MPQLLELPEEQEEWKTALQRYASVSVQWHAAAWRWTPLEHVVHDDDKSGLGFWMCQKQSARDKYLYNTQRTYVSTEGNLDFEAEEECLHLIYRILPSNLRPINWVLWSIAEELAAMPSETNHYQKEKSRHFHETEMPSEMSRYGTNRQRIITFQRVRDGWKYRRKCSWDINDAVWQCRWDRPQRRMLEKITEPFQIKSIEGLWPTFAWIKEVTWRSDDIA